MFLKDIHEYSLPDVDAVEEKSFTRRLKYRQSLQKDLRKRFRSEYLGLLIQRPIARRNQLIVSVDNIVLVGAGNNKRIHRTLRRVNELVYGEDRKMHLVKLQTCHSEIHQRI